MAIFASQIDLICNQLYIIIYMQITVFTLNCLRDCWDFSLEFLISPYIKLSFYTEIIYEIVAAAISHGIPHSNLGLSIRVLPNI